jgi:hypothetical protein
MWYCAGGFLLTIEPAGAMWSVVTGPTATSGHQKGKAECRNGVGDGAFHGGRFRSIEWTIPLNPHGAIYSTTEGVSGRAAPPCAVRDRGGRACP